MRRLALALALVATAAHAQVPTFPASGPGPAPAVASSSGTVTSLTAGAGIALTPSTITSTGSIAIDSTVATLTDVQTLTNKTLTAPTMTAPVLGTIASGVGTALTALNGSNISSGTVADARLSANVPLLNAANTFTANQVVSGASFGLSGNITGANILGTAGVRYKNVVSTITDTAISGVNATGYTDIFGGNTIAASNATTFTNYYAAYFKAPVAGAGVTFTNNYALGADSISTAKLLVNGAGGLTVTGGSGNINVTGGSGFQVANTADINQSFGGGLAMTSAKVYAWSNSTSAFSTIDTGLSRISAGILGVGTGAQGSTAGSMSMTGLTVAGGAQIITTSTALTNGAGSSAGTLANAPSVGNPTKWIGINDNGTIRYVPAW